MKPKSGGGLDSWDNLVLACWGCNTSRGMVDAWEFAAAPFHHIRIHQVAWKLPARKLRKHGSVVLTESAFVKIAKKRKKQKQLKLALPLPPTHGTILHTHDSTFNWGLPEGTVRIA